LILIRNIGNEKGKKGDLKNFDACASGVMKMYIFKLHQTPTTRWPLSFRGKGVYRRLSINNAKDACSSNLGLRKVRKKGGDLPKGRCSKKGSHDSLHHFIHLAMSVNDLFSSVIESEGPQKHLHGLSKGKSKGPHKGSAFCFPVGTFKSFLVVLEKLLVGP